MTNRPIPRRGLLGCWFLDDRGITYDAGANEAIDRSGRGNHATYQNGVTVGVEGDPSRDFGAAAFDASSNQFADVGDPLAVGGDQANVAIVKADSWGSSVRTLYDNEGNSGGVRLGLSGATEGEIFGFAKEANTSNVISVNTGLQEGEYWTLTHFVSETRGEQGLLVDGEVVTASISGVGLADSSFLIGLQDGTTRYFDGEIAAVGRYDLTVPNAPEPSAIARRWDRLTDIPATR